MPTVTYKPRNPTQCILFQVVREHFETFRCAAADGFACFQCHDCGHDRLVPFSCKGRGSTAAVEPS